MSNNIPDDHTPLWNRLDQHSAQIIQIQRDQGRLEGRLDSLEVRLDRAFKEITEALTRMETKQDGREKEMRQLVEAQSDQLSQAEGARRSLVWAGSTLIAIISTVAIVWNTVFGG